jgi:hypothetical protein
MARQNINIGAAPDDGTGDDLRSGGQKIDDNFTELYGDRARTETASEAIGDGCFLNYHSSGGAKVRKANATDNTKPCRAYAPAAIANGDPGAVQLPGSVIAGLAGLTPGADYFLDTAAGAITLAAPSGAGNLVQLVGFAVSATELFFNPQPGVTL